MTILIGLRPYHERDLPAVARVWLESWNGTGLHPSDRPTIVDYENRLIEEGCIWDIYVAVIASEVCGFIAFQRPDGWLRQLFIAPDKQKSGLGSALLRIAKREMQSGFWLHADEDNGAARNFYEKSGLTISGRTLHPKYGHRMIAYVWENST